MKRKIAITILALFIVLITAFLLSGCQSITKTYGGTTTIELEPNQKLEEITWKDDSLWYLTRPMTDNDIAETHTFHESSNYGILEGTVIVIETKK